MKLSLTALIVVVALCAPAHATLLWNWSYEGGGVSAAGTFTTDDTPDASGFYRITGLTGQRNGVAITALTPAGAGIPGNGPYVVDDRVRVAGSQLTVNGFGFALSDGTYSSPFFDGSANPSRYLEFYSAPATGSTTEKPIVFSAAIAPAPAAK
jgi:hypothetical protein